MKRAPVAHKRTPLEHVKRLIKKLSAEERQAIIPYLSEFPDTGIKSFNLREELDVLKKHGTRLTSPGDNPDAYLLDLVFIRNLVSVEIRGSEILRAVFFPGNFVEAFPKLKWQISITSKTYQEKIFTEERREKERAARKAEGVEETDAQYEEDVKKRCDAAAEYWLTEKAKRIAEQISLHLPGMVGDMMSAAIKGQTFYDLHKAYEALAPDKKPMAVKDLKKLIQDAAWRDIKPHLPQDRNTRTNRAWRDEGTLKQYARRVSDRTPLVSSIKDMYEDCEGEAGWIEDLQLDSTYQLLSRDVPDEILIWARKRVASDDMSAREREPRSIACEMARRELDLPEQSVETLREYYRDGAKLLRQERSQRS